ncbi:hypothetical protein D5S18_10830 [Nocardia panacis]|uniref:Uncharacterized protein n=2 Tax=Nocardia panacis TaxID=2340916 RepID=A0A3A4JZB2_9NOCA|nr:hypothetical protein D5S18_10830 [Nocardia panacis]
MWFGLATIALIGAIVLLYFDRKQRQRTGHARQVWAKSQAYTYVSVEPALASTWRRGALAKLGYLSAVDVVSGVRKGEKFVLFDLEDSATLVAVRRQIGSDIDIDMRLKTASPPKDADLELLGAIGDRVVFATNPEIARHAVDQRMVAFIETLPDAVQMLWSEGNWTLGMLSVGTASRDWESAIDSVLRLSGLLHVLPPVSDSRVPEPSPDSGRAPRSRQESDEFAADRAEFAPQRTFDKQRPAEENRRPEERRPAEDRRPVGERHPVEERRPVEDRRPLGDQHSPDLRSEDRHPSGGSAPADEIRPEPRMDPADRDAPRRPSLAVVPDARAKARAEWQADTWPDDDEDDWVPEAEQRPVPRPHEPAAPEQAGGPFHPGFRPYQGPVPK